LIYEFLPKFAPCDRGNCHLHLKCFLGCSWIFISISYYTLYILQFCVKFS
jgi:hypothetical protein